MYDSNGKIIRFSDDPNEWGVLDPHNPDYKMKLEKRRQKRAERLKKRKAGVPEALSESRPGFVRKARVAAPQKRDPRETQGMDEQTRKMLELASGFSPMREVSPVGEEETKNMREAFRTHAPVSGVHFREDTKRPAGFVMSP